jgi:uncharacterized MAPEG superfamily protein
MKEKEKERHSMHGFINMEIATVAKNGNWEPRPREILFRVFCVAWRIEEANYNFIAVGYLEKEVEEEVQTHP